MTQNEELELSTSEKEAIEQLRERMPDMDKNIYDDTYQLYSFLKAQDFDINLAETMLSKCLQWRKTIQIDAIRDYKPPEVIQKYFENHLIAFDKQGSPVYYTPVGKLDAKGIYMSTKFIDLEKRLVKSLEEELEVLKKNRKTPDGPYPGIIVIFDMEGLSFANATDKKGLEYITKILKVIQEYYPGFLRALYILNISSYFSIPFSIVKSCLSSSIVDKVHILGTDTKKEELLEIIDANQLPAYLGGNKTDPDGNPLCKTLLMQAGKIDEKYYIHKSKNPLVNSPGVQKLVLARASFSELELEVKEDGFLIEWEFETKTRDVGFGLFYKETVDGEEKITELVPLLRIDTEDYSETGVYKCEKAGTYIVLFDNSYSWIRSKEIYYRIKIVSPKEQEAELQI